MKSSLWLCMLGVGLGLLATTPASAAPPSAMARVYTPYKVDAAALAPDGEHAAFTVATKQGKEVQILRTRAPFGPATTVRLPQAGDLRWISSGQLMSLSSTGALAVISVNGGKPRLIDTSAQHIRKITNQAQLSWTHVAPVPDDPASVLITYLLKLGLGESSRTHAIQSYRLNVMTGEVRQVLDHLVEHETRPEDVIIDRTGEPRLVHRRGAQDPFFAYLEKENALSLGQKTANAVFGDDVQLHLAERFDDGSHFLFSLGAPLIMTERTVPVAFAQDSQVLIYASNLKRDTFGLYAVDLRTGKPTDFAVEEPGIDLVDPETPWANPPLVFDRRTGALAGVRLRASAGNARWLDPDLAWEQRELERAFPGRRAKIIEWDDQRERFLTLVSGSGDPGRYFVHDRTVGGSMELMRAVPGLRVREEQPSEPIAFSTPAGVRITGYLTQARNPPSKTSPGVIVVMHDGPWQRVDDEYDRDAQALATMGFTVVKINYRGSLGLGVAHREAIRTALDTAPLDDALATLEWLRQERGIDPRRAGLLGEGYGGYLALRGLQLHPEAFHAAVAINAVVTPLQLSIAGDSFGHGMGLGDFVPGARVGPPPDVQLKRWLVAAQPGLNDIDATARPEAYTQPVFLLHNPDLRDAPIDPIRSLRASIRRRQPAPEWMELSGAFARPDSDEHVTAYGRIGEFFNATLYTFTVKIGEEKEIKDEGPERRDPKAEAGGP